MKVFESNIIYENPLPQLCSKQAFFPNMAQLDDGTIAACYVIGQAFESVDSASYLSFSKDNGVTWTKPQSFLEFDEDPSAITDYTKITKLSDGKLVAFGYTFFRDNPELPVGNPENGGLLDDFLFYSVSEDNGKTWSKPSKVDCSWGPHVEASAPLVELKDGSWITPITGFADWEGKFHGKNCGRALRSDDKGKTWNDDSICMEFEGDQISCFEQRMCQLESGAIICIGWNENFVTGERLPNHFTASFDNGKTWTKPESTGVQGQASSVCALGGDKLLAIHAVRRDTDKPGIYGYIVDFSNKTWNIVDSALLWAPSTPIVKDTKMAEIFSFIKFGQPSAIKLADNSLLMIHWFAQDGQYKTAATRIEL